MSSLFENKLRTNHEPSKYNENIFNYIDYSAVSEVSEIREVINKWFLKYPDEEQEELKSRFRKTFSSAFYELFLHELFLNQGFVVEIHPKLDGSNKRPDFLIRKEGNEFYVEAKEIRDKSRKAEGNENKLNEFLDKLNTVDSSNFLLSIKLLEFKTEKQPSTKKMIADLNSQLSALEPDEVSERLITLKSKGKTTVSYEDENVKLICELMPILSKYRGVPRRAIGMNFSDVVFGGSEGSIVQSFKSKVKRYGTLDKPYIICLNILNGFGDTGFDAEKFLWGSIAVTFSTNPKKRDERLERLKDGVFLTDKGPQNINVAGILITKVTESNLSICNHWFAKHPFIENHNGFCSFDLEYKFVEDGNIVSSKGKTIREILR